MGARLVRGRAFTDGDNADSPPVAIVDESFVRRFWPDEDPIGKRIAIFTGGGNPRIWREVVGVVAHQRHYNLSAEGREQAYIPYKQVPSARMFLAVRTSTDPTALAPTIRREVLALKPDQPIADVQTMETRASHSLAGSKFNLLLLGSFAAIALVMAAVGIFGVISYTVSQRSHEIGVRMALGADAGKVVSLVLRQGAVYVIAGLALGVAAAFGLSRLLTSLLYEVRPSDPLTYLWVATVLAAVAGLACCVPALRATRYHPVEVLRGE